MSEARRMIQSGEINGTAYIVANHQTQGRGTQGRSWSSPEGAGLYLSIVHLPTANEAFETTHLYTLAAGVACAEALRAVTGLSLHLKPINDLYINGGKLGGILVESDLHPRLGLTGLITGIGINIHRHEHVLDRGEIRPVSLQDVLEEDAFTTLSRQTLVEAVVGKVCFWYSLVFSGWHGQVIRTWERYQLPGTTPLSALNAPPGGWRSIQTPIP